MKKLLFYLSVVLLTIAFGACSNDDDTPDNIVKKDLFVEASSITIDIGGTVIFTAFDDQKKEVIDVEFYVDGVKSPKECKFEKRGVYNVVAKKTGYNTSVSLAIMVGGAIAEKLVLTANSIEVFKGEPVTFTVTVDGKEIDGYYIEQIKSGVFEYNVWSTRETGIYEFKAIKEGYLNSDIVTITVKEKEIKEDQFFIIDGVKYGIDEVLLEVDIIEVEEEDDGEEKVKVYPYIYTNELDGRKYQMYRLFAGVEGNVDYTIVEIAVFMTDKDDYFVFPHEVEPSNIVLKSGIGIINEDIVIEAEAKDIAEFSSQWPVPFKHETEPGVVEYKLISKDKRLQINYKGEYMGLAFNEIKEKTNHPKPVKSFFSMKKRFVKNKVIAKK